MYIAICDVKSVPENIPMETNPREQNLNTNVAKKIKNSLLDTSSLDFYLLNRGILLSAKEVSFNNYSNEITIIFEDLEVHGNVDGGHTYRTILKHRDKLDAGQQFAILDKAGPELVESTVSMSRSLVNNPQSTGKDVNLWKTLYMTVAFAAMK